MTGQIWTIFTESTLYEIIISELCMEECILVLIGSTEFRMKKAIDKVRFPMSVAM